MAGKKKVAKKKAVKAAPKKPPEVGELVIDSAAELADAKAQVKELKEQLTESKWLVRDIKERLRAAESQAAYWQRNPRGRAGRKGT